MSADESKMMGQDGDEEGPVKSMQTVIGGEDYLWVGLLFGFFLGSLVTCLCYKRKIKREIRERYIQLSMAQGQIEWLEKTLQGTVNKSWLRNAPESPEEKRNSGSQRQILSQVLATPSEPK